MYIIVVFAIIIVVSKVLLVFFAFSTVLCKLSTHFGCDNSGFESAFELPCEIYDCKLTCGQFCIFFTGF